MLQNKIHNKNFLFILSLILIDLTSVTLAFATSYVLRDKGFFRYFLDSIQPIEIYLVATPFAASLLILLFMIHGLYSLKNRHTHLSELHSILKAVSIWILLIMAGSYLTKYDYSRIIVLLLFVFTLFYDMILRYLLRRYQEFFFPDGFSKINVAIIGTGKLAKEVRHRLYKNHSALTNFVGFIQTKHTAYSSSETVGSITSLQTLIKKYAISEVYIADQTLTHDRILTMIAKSSKHKVKFKIVSDMFDLITGKVDVSEFESIPSLDVRKMSFPLWKRTYKYIFDVLLASALLLITLPFFGVFALLIKVDSNGSIFITQKRIGLNSKPFSIYKFRTMKSRTPLYNKSPMKKTDQRVTRVGVFLRKHSLDELPQLFNILKGDMSFVGPRPEMQFIVKNYNTWEKRRLSVKPGLTGLWQILGRKDLPLTENLEYDFYYINNQSLLLDIVILLKTIPVVISGKGAY